MGQAAYGGGVSETVLHPAVLVAMLCAIALIFVLPRKYVMVPVLVMTFLVPLGQQIYAGGIHWLVLRIIVLSGLLRAMTIKSSTGRLAGGFNAVDKAFFACTFLQAVAFVLLYNMAPQAINYQAGFLIDFVGMYFLVRVLIADEDDIYRSLKWMAFIAVILAITMTREQFSVQNVFGLLGGTRDVPDIREGKIRSQGVFQHALTAGTLAATLLPLFLLLWKNGRAKIAGLAGMVACTVMTICSNSSTSLLTYAASVIGICMWPVRKQMRAVRVGIVTVLVVLHLVMKSPVWFLMARIDLTGGSSGYHRAELIDQFIRHFTDWWLIGTKDAVNWAWDMWDQQNEFVRVGETGGLAALVVFIIMIARLCARLGNARKLVEGEREEWTLWLLGASVCATLVGFLGVNYFDQSKVGWFMLLAMVIAATAAIFDRHEAEEAESSEEAGESQFVSQEADLDAVSR